MMVGCSLVRWYGTNVWRNGAMVQQDGTAAQFVKQATARTKETTQNEHGERYTVAKKPNKTMIHKEQ